MSTKAKANDRFLCIGCLVQVVVGSEARVYSATVRFQREQRLCTRCMYRRENEPKPAEKHPVNPFERGEIAPDLFQAPARWT
jgi:hypothetical protein